MFSFFKRLKAVRGAVFTDNTPEQIKEDVIALYSEIINKNKIKNNNKLQYLHYKMLLLISLLG